MAASPVAVGDSYDRLASARSSDPAAGSPLCAGIARVALEQFRRWRPRGGNALVETSPAASAILREYYRVGVGTAVTDAQMQSAAFQSVHPWSAVFVSYVMRTAGAGPAFAYSALHQTYIRAARHNRLTRNTANPFWAFRATEVAPRVGDLVCAARSSPGATYDNIADPQKWWQTHCDVVVEVQPGRIRVIGGNVGQTVGEKWLRTLADGRLSLVGAQSRLFAVICCRPGPASPPAPTPTPIPGAAGEDARILRVMELLVNRYRYPVNGAAGLVGNLIAESSVLPNRIEGSHSSTPMRAPDFTGRLAGLHCGPGPRSELRPAHRAASSRHRDRAVDLPEPQGGAVPAQPSADGSSGSAILSDLDAQVDYLVAELHRDYRPVNATLMSPSVTVEQACDAVLLRFERPASVLEPTPHRSGRPDSAQPPSRSCRPRAPGLPSTFQWSMKRGMS